MEERAAVCRQVRAVEGEYMSGEHELDSVIERMIINSDGGGDDDDDDDNTSISTGSCEYHDDIQAVGPNVSDSR